MDATELLSAVRAAAGDDFDVLGEIARDGTKTIVFLARDQQSKNLVVLKLVQGDQSTSGPDEYSLEVAEKLDATVPDIESRCSRCGAKLRRWARFCTQCGADVSGIAPSSGENLSQATLRNAVYAAAAAEFEILGEMPRAEGGGLVYFGRKRSTGDIVALRLQRESESEYALDVTRVLKPVTSPTSRAAGSGGVDRVEITGVSRARPILNSAASPVQPSQPTPRPPQPFAGRAALDALRRRIEANPNPYIVGAFMVVALSLLTYVIVKVFK
jgi:hypothetical protein